MVYRFENTMAKKCLDSIKLYEATKLESLSKIEFERKSKSKEKNQNLS